MNSMPFSLGTCTTPINRYILTSTPRLVVNQNLRNAESSVIKFSSNRNSSFDANSKEPSISSGICSRRGAIGIGLCFSLVEFILQPEPTAAAEATPCEFTETPSGLAFCDKVSGDGPQAEKGQLIKAHYTGKLVNGTVFDSSYNRGKPLTFRVGVGEVIKGWDQGILGGDGVPPMLTGGKRTLKIPPELAYGARGAGCRGGTCIIPPNSVLLFDVEFVGKA
ncbi:peptidyl-prolyl cis-trans isomerase FKBP13, chloroplastic [Coffea eugenioides]|uniref:peptidyl-prolyl cis-trans isomerase FKBP13, chloroplastic n=1 Tax=Coffea eugenioides TaxID=49369 RepID=UPI000F6095B1|nr:peptidyl-prolyl cis-trans isomerase FKBP13, chloroplastic [Coffea eugenioides]